MAAVGRARGLWVEVSIAAWGSPTALGSPMTSGSHQSSLYICSLFPHLPGGGNSRMRTVAWWELSSAWNSAWQ